MTTETKTVKVGSIVSYGDYANDRKKAAVVAVNAANPNEFIIGAGMAPAGERYSVIFLDGRRSDTTKASLDGPGGWHYEEGELSYEELAELVKLSEERDIRLEKERKEAGEARAKREADFKAWVAANKPPWAKAVIVATLVVDESDSMTDYFATRDTRKVLLAWSKHKRNLFPEMRKAAAKFEPTKHLGPGKGVYKVAVVFTNDVINPDHGDLHYEGNISHHHRELLPEKDFETREEAEAFVANSPAPEPISFGGVVGHFKFKITEESIEHRENYSMGHGYYLKGSHRYSSGWEVSKDFLTYISDADTSVLDKEAGK
jgi:hypothetical protein